MILEIQHETCLEYSRPISEWLSELRVEPLSDPDQSCQTFSLRITGDPPTFRYRDGFGNRVHHFNLLLPPNRIEALAASVVETHPQTRDLESSRALIPLDPAELPLEALDLMQFRGPVRASERLAPIVAALRPLPGARVADIVRNVSTYIFQHFRYAKAVTTATSPIDDLLEQGQGVCQDFAHLMLAILRSFRIPARYVSGYIHRPGKESQSHAWCEAWIPDLGWVGIDPTNDTLVNEHFVKVAVGRDYTDVAPNRGVYRGSGEEKIFARVQTRQLERLPTLSWQDQLPKLDVPLTMVLTTLQREPSSTEEDQQQQQQQQQ